MSAINFILSLARKILARESKGITTIPNKMAVEQKAGEIAATLQNAGLPLNRADEFIKSEQDLTRILNMIESTPPVMKEVPSGIKSTKSAEVFDLEGKKIDPKKGIMGGRQIDDLPPGDDDLPPPGSRGGPDDIAAPIQSADESLRDMMEAEIKKTLETGNKKGIARIRARQKMLNDAIDDASPGFSGDRKVDAELVAENLAERMGKVYDDLPTKERLKLYDEAFQGLTKKKFDPEDMAQGGRAGFSKGGIDVLKLEDEALQRAINAFKYYQRMGGKKNFRDYLREAGRFGDQFRAEGGRIGFKDGMTRRTFLKLLGGMAAVPIVGKFFKLAKIGKTVTKVPMIKTDDVAGKPEWFDALVNKVIVEGDDVTKRFATAERQRIHQKTLDDGSVVRVTEDVDDGAVRVEYESEQNVFGDDVMLQYKKPLPDEGDPRPRAEFTTAESGPVGRQFGPDDYEIEIDEVGGSSIRDLDSDVSKLKQYATGKGPTMREIVQNKKRRDKAKAISEDSESQMDAVIRRQGDYVDDDFSPDFASGGIARMLGE
jgi:hypothetical protein